MFIVDFQLLFLLLGAFIHILSWIAAFFCEESRKRWPTTQRFTFLWVACGVLLIAAGVCLTNGYDAAMVILMWSGLVVGPPFIILAVIYHARQDEASGLEALVRAIKANPELLALFASQIENEPMEQGQ